MTLIASILLFSLIDASVAKQMVAPLNVNSINAVCRGGKIFENTTNTHFKKLFALTSFVTFVIKISKLKM